LVKKKSTFSKDKKASNGDKKYLDIGNLMEFKKLTFPVSNMNHGDRLD